MRGNPETLSGDSSEYLKPRITAAIKFKMGSHKTITRAFIFRLQKNNNEGKIQMSDLTRNVLQITSTPFLSLTHSFTQALPEYMVSRPKKMV
jgi:hypothetical protein